MLEGREALGHAAGGVWRLLARRARGAWACSEGTRRLGMLGGRAPSPAFVPTKVAFLLMKAKIRPLNL